MCRIRAILTRWTFLESQGCADSYGFRLGGDDGVIDGELSEVELKKNVVFR